MRVSEIADELGVDSKHIRRFLRSEYGNVGTGGRWDLNPQQVEVVQWKFGADNPRAPRAPRASGMGGGLNIPPLVRRKSGPQIVDLVRSLRDHPQDVVIPIRESTEKLTFHRIMNRWTGGRRSGNTVVLLSNGEFKQASSLTGIAEYLLESQYCIIRRGEKYYLHHRNFVNSLMEIDIPLQLVPHFIERSNTGRDDSPQEVLMGDYSVTFTRLLSTEFILLWEFSTGKPIGEITLEELWPQVPLAPMRSYSGITPHSYIRRYFSTINTLREIPPHGEAFRITLGEVFRRFHIEVGEKARELRQEVASKYGFEPTSDGGWIKRKGSDMVEIKDDLGVHINRKFICVVSAKTSYLPYDDEVARRMLTVATAHRNQIYTFRGEAKSTLERLFPIGNKSGKGN